ncbi:MAG: hypothetical protein JRH11_17265, partial [Deltaproteobacteria bacterium]|nr:hypothetical protein [Deltaproteobacteria bacterium]
WRDDQRAAATRLFREVGRRSGAVAEAAWIRLARLHLRDGNPRGALSAVAAHRRRFADGRLGAEALWLEVDARRRLGDDAAAARAVERLQATYPSSPQARAAARGTVTPEAGE